MKIKFNITSTSNNKYEFKVHCKKAIINIHIKPTSCIDPNIIKSVFKGFLRRAHSMFRKIYQRRKVFNRIFNRFVENGHNKQLLKNLAIKYNNKKNNKNNHENNTEN